MKNRILIATVAVLVSFSTVAFGQFTNIVENRTGGQHFSDYSEGSGWANSSGNVNAPGCTSNIGSRYSGATLYFGPARYSQFNYTPATGYGGYYDIALAWTSSAGETNTAVNLYTGAATGGPADPWGNAGGPVGIVYQGTMDMLYKNVGVWNDFTTAKLAEGTTYHVGIYAGRLAVGTENRVHSGAVRFLSSTPDAAVNGGPANGATGIPLTGEGNELTWTAGSCDSFFDVFLGLAPGSLTKIGTVLEGAPLSFDLDGQGLVANTPYYWRVDAGNVNLVTQGTESSFTTIPEPTAALLGLLGVSVLTWIRRRRVAKSSL